MNSKKVYDGKFLDIFIDSYKKDGKIINWERCSRKNKTNAVMIVAKHIDKQKYIMISEFRIPINAREVGFPAGLIEEGESIEETVKRELKEETGFDLVHISEISPLLYNSSGMTDEGVYIVYCDVTGNYSNQFLEPSEDIVPFLASPEDMYKLMRYSKDLKWGSKAWIICNNIINNELIKANF